MQTFLSNINTADTTHNRTFWKTVKPFFTNKVETCSKITLIEKSKCSDQTVVVVIKQVIFND